MNEFRSGTMFVSRIRLEVGFIRKSDKMSSTVYTVDTNIHRFGVLVTCYTLKRLCLQIGREITAGSADPVY